MNKKIEKLIIDEHYSMTTVIDGRKEFSVYQYRIEDIDDLRILFNRLIDSAVEEEREEGDKRWIKATSSLIKKTVEEEQERVRNRIEAKEKFHRKKFKEFQEKTNGNVMNGHLIKAETCKEFLLLIKE